MINDNDNNNNNDNNDNNNNDDDNDNDNDNNNNNNNNNNNKGPNGHLFLRRWRPHDEERHAAYYDASRWGLEYCVALSAVLNFDYLGELSH